MDYEKKYKEALANARQEYNTTENVERKQWLEELFPELKESEEERIRKAILDYLTKMWGNSQDDVCGVHVEDAIAWLEKQGQDKEINKFEVLPGLYKCVHRMFAGTPESKLLFEVGNIYKCLSKHDRAEFEVSYGHSVYLEDPVVCKHFIPFEMQGEQKPILDFKAKDWYVSKVDGKIRNIYQSVDKVEPKFEIGDVLCDKSCTTVNKESQPNFEITDIRNGMYICDKCSFPISQQDEYELVAKRIEQNSAWNKEDEERLKSCLNIIQAKGMMGVTDTINTKWLKSLKERIGG